MNYKWKKENPIEMIRMAEKMSQKDFARKLGYPNKDQFKYHMRNFTDDIIGKIIKIYDQDLRMEIINFLKFELRNLKKQIKTPKRKTANVDSNESDVEKNVTSLLDRI